ncbi:MAG: LysR family transcriptional regulator [Paracoccaceae bacterium]
MQLDLLNPDRPMSRISTPEPLACGLDWNLLRVFLALAEAGSVTGAAERLSLKQPSVSAALKRLEERVGARLIDRARRRFQLTAAGVRLLAAIAATPLGERIYGGDA